MIKFRKNIDSENDKHVKWVSKNGKGKKKIFYTSLVYPARNV